MEKKEKFRGRWNSTCKGREVQESPKELRWLECRVSSALAGGGIRQAVAVRSQRTQQALLSSLGFVLHVMDPHRKGFKRHEPDWICVLKRPLGLLSENGWLQGNR